VNQDRNTEEGNEPELFSDILFLMPGLFEDINDFENPVVGLNNPGHTLNTTHDTGFRIIGVHGLGCLEPENSGG
jgi:hypothetical protein